MVKIQEIGGQFCVLEYKNCLIGKIGMAWVIKAVFDDENTAINFVEGRK